MKPEVERRGARSVDGFHGQKCPKSGPPFLESRKHIRIGALSLWKAVSAGDDAKTCASSRGRLAQGFQLDCNVSKGCGLAVGRLLDLQDNVMHDRGIAGADFDRADPGVFFEGFGIMNCLISPSPLAGTK